jgi:uncharacterized protein (AIM24 family)
LLKNFAVCFFSCVVLLLLLRKSKQSHFRSRFSHSVIAASLSLSPFCIIVILTFSTAMAYMSDGMKMSVQLAGVGKTFGRLAGGGSLFQITYTNEDPALNGYVAMTPDYPGVIVPINMAACPSGKVIAMRDSFLCATVGMAGEMTDVGAGFNPAESVQGFCCSGIDFIVQTLSHGEWAFLMAMGTVVQRNLADGEKILVDTDSVLCFDSSVKIDVQYIGSCMTCLCSGEVRRKLLLLSPAIFIQMVALVASRSTVFVKFCQHLFLFSNLFESHRVFARRQ